MNALTRLVLFGLTLGAVLVAGFGVGRAVGPFEDDPAPPPAEHQTTDHQMGDGS